jgi:hypothetical protein
MGRILTLALLCVIGLGLSAPGARAQQINIGGDPDTMLMDIYLRDADIPEVLTALFNTTNGKYQLKLDPSVVGRVSRLQLTATPFEKALDAILGNEFSFQKKQTDQGFLYTITGRNAGAPRTGFGAPLNAPPADEPTTAVEPSTKNVGVDQPKTSASGFPLLSYMTPKTSKTGTTGTGTGAGTPGTTTTEGEEATEELAVVKMIGINYLDLESICDALGGSTIELFDQSSYGGGSNSSGGGRSSRNNNNDNYNNNNNNNYDTNNSRTNNTNDRNNTNNSRTTRTSRTNNNNTL